MHELLDFIKAVGVPAAITFYVLHRVECKLDKLTQAVLKLPERFSPCPSSTSSKPAE